MEDILYVIITNFLEFEDITRCIYVNKLFYKLCKHEFLWEKLWIYDFNDTEIFKNNYYKTYKLCFRIKKFRDKYSYITYKDSHYLNCAMVINGCSIDVLYNSQEFYNKYGTPLSCFPREIKIFKNLISLTLNYKKLKNVTKEIGKLYNLKYLNFEHNKLTEMPPELGKLHNLEYLNLGHNYLTKIPVGLDNMKNLEIFILNFNSLTNISVEDIKNFHALQFLDISNNNIITIPKIIKLLVFHNNYVSPMSAEEIEKLPILQYLGISYYDTILLPKITNLPNFKTFLFHGNKTDRVINKSDFPPLI